MTTSFTQDQILELAETNPGLALMFHRNDCPTCLEWVYECGRRGTIVQMPEGVSIPHVPEEEYDTFTCDLGRGLQKMILGTIEDMAKRRLRDRLWSGLTT